MNNIGQNKNTMNTEIKLNKRAAWAVTVLKSTGAFQVTVAKPGASPIFTVRDAAGYACLTWVKSTTLHYFAQGVSRGIEIGKKLARG